MHEIANAERKNLQNQGIPLFGSGTLGNFFGGMGSSILRGFGDLATFAGANNVANLFHSGSDYFEERLKPAKLVEFSMDYIMSPEGLARGVGNTAGSIISIAAPTAFIPGG